MRASDLSDEERAAHYAQVQRTLDQADATLDSLAARAERRRADGTEFEERHQERLRRQAAAQQQQAAQQQAPKPPARPALLMDRDMAAALNIWVDRKITRFGEVVAGEIGKTTGELGARLRDLEDRMTQSERATLELLTEFERRIADLEKRLPSPPPRLVRSA